jgi:hypothetical protein
MTRAVQIVPIVRAADLGPVSAGQLTPPAVSHFLLS